MKKVSAVGLLLGLLLVIGPLLGGCPGAGELKPYYPQDFNSLKGMKGFSNTLLEQHFQLYQGYVKNTNQLAEQLRQLAPSSLAYAELRRRFGWEFNGMRLHELYFSNLGGNGDLKKDSPVRRKLEEQFGSYDNWAADFQATGAMRGIGWVMLYEDPLGGRWFNTWINEHDAGHLAGGRPLVIMDVFEHAYMTDYGLKKGDYIKAFFQNLNWEAVEKRAKPEAAAAAAK